MMHSGRRPPAATRRVGGLLLSTHSPLSRDFTCDGSQGGVRQAEVEREKAESIRWCMHAGLGCPPLALGTLVEVRVMRMRWMGAASPPPSSPSFLSVGLT